MAYLASRASRVAKGSRDCQACLGPLASLELGSQASLGPKGSEVWVVCLAPWGQRGRRGMRGHLAWEGHQGSQASQDCRASWALQGLPVSQDLKEKGVL